MLDIIYTSVGLLTVTLAIVYLIFMLVTSVKGEYSIAKNIKCRIVFSVVLCVLFVIQTILAIVLARSGFVIGSDIFCALIWALNIVLGFSSLKTAEDTTPTIEIRFIITPCFEDEDEETEENDTSEETENK